MTEIAIFAAKTLLIFLAIAGVILVIAVAAARANDKSELEVEPLHEKYKDLGVFLKSFTLSKEEQKKEKKKLKKEKKKESSEGDKSKIFVLNFDGDTRASQVESLREEITTLLQIATAQDEVVVRLESPGGVVHGYGLAASQLRRIRDRGIPLVVCVDKVAASGGYLMACVASRVLAAPFAIIGSIGVVAQVPNVHRLLRKHDVDFKEYTAGEFKRTVSLLGEITPKGEQKFQEQLESVHSLFKTFVSTHRPQVQIDKVATGEYWYGEQSQALGLIDHIQTSDDYLLEKYSKDAAIYEVRFAKHQPWWNKFTEATSQIGLRILEKAAKRWNIQGDGNQFL